MHPPVGEGQTLEAARQGMVWTLFHHGLTGWCMYALIGMALGYFSYRYNLPLTIRSALYPIFGNKIHGPIGHSVDTAAVIGTILVLRQPAGIGVVQLNYGLHGCSVTWKPLDANRINCGCGGNDHYFSDFRGE